MIIVKIQGGLGNQMFQYALGRNLSLIHNAECKIDTSYLQKPNQSSRIFRLSGYDIKASEATKEEINSYCSNLQKFLDKFRPEKNKKRIKEEGAFFNSEILKISSGYFDGHWNSEKYFDKNAEIIRKDFQLKSPLSGMAENVAREITSQENSVSIHVRRGDYVSIQKIANVHGALSLSYYSRAISKIQESVKNPHFFVFSDDIEWTKENLSKSVEITFVSNPKIEDYEEMHLMSMCKHNIIANSTFSWWASWLNQNPNKIVISPKNWFVDQNRKTDLLNSSWIQTL